MAPRAVVALEATVEERLSSLETGLAQITKLVRELHAAQPISDRDISF
jgi:hypothetical protein